MNALGARTTPQGGSADETGLSTPQSVTILTFGQEIVRLRQALRDVADLTAATQYDEPFPPVVRFASRVNKIASDALRNQA